MRVCQFNFNNEVNLFEIHVEDDGRVTVPGENGPIGEFDSVQQLAEIYATARDVKPENLKNWTLLENGNVYSFVLRAGTAGLTVSEAEEQLETVFASALTAYHPLNVARAKEQIMSDGGADLVEALVHCTEADIARDIYDLVITAENAVNGNHAEDVPVEEDTRSELEKYIDDMAEVPGALSFIATLAGLSADADKAAVLEACAASYAFSNVSSLRAVYDNAISDAISNGIGVNTGADALTVITQTPAGVKDDSIKDRMMAAAGMAGRDKVNVSVDIVGNEHIRHTAEMVNLEDLAGVDLYVRDNIPYIVRFDPTIDAELEAERDLAEQETEEDSRTVTGAEVRRTIHPDGSYENDYVPDDDDDDEDDDEDDQEEEDY